MVANDRAVDAMNNGIELAERADPSTPATSKIHFYAKDKSGVSTLYAINDAGTVYEIGEGRPTFFTAIVGTLITGTDQVPLLPVPRGLTIVKAYARVKTAPTGAAIILDINLNATSIWASTQANRLTIADGASSGSQTSFDTTALVEDDYLSLDVDQVGSTIAGAGLSVYLRCKY